MSTLRGLARPFFVLAPMDDVTDTVFRQIVAETAAPDLFFTEFANVDGLQSPGRPRLMKKLVNTPKDQPLIAHIWGKNPENFYKTAFQVANGTLGNFVGIDLNMGCPVKTVVGHGVCSALMKNRPLAHEIIEATRAGLDAGSGTSNNTGPEAVNQSRNEAGEESAGRLPLSVKTRLGYSEIDLSWHEFLLGHNLDMLTIHGRTRAQMSKVPADWDTIGQVRELRDKFSPTTLIVGNGDVMSRPQGLELAEKYKLDGIMIGRGIFHDPFVFAQKSPWESIPEIERITMYQKHVELFKKTWQRGEHPIHTLNKFCKIYINGFDGAKEMREEFMQAGSVDELLTIIDAAVTGM